MIEFSAYLAAQQVTRDAVREALPDAPVRAEHQMPRRAFPRLAVRQRLSLTLHRLADLIEPRPEPCQPVAAGYQ